MPTIVWTDYVKYRVSLRGYDFKKLEDILLHSTERYLDNETGRTITVGRHEERLVMIPCEGEGNEDNSGNRARDDTTANPISIASGEV